MIRWNKFNSAKKYRTPYCSEMRPGIPVVAVSNARYLDPEDAVCRAVIRYNTGILDTEPQPLYHFRTTAEMLEAFRFLGKDVAKEIVIDAPRRIANLVDNHLALFPAEGKSYPVLPGAEEHISGEAMIQAHSFYGDSLPPQVEERLRDELAIIEPTGIMDNLRDSQAYCRAIPKRWVSSWYPRGSWLFTRLPG